VTCKLCGRPLDAPLEDKEDYVIYDRDSCYTCNADTQRLMVEVLSEAEINIKPLFEEVNLWAKK
jgi:hypothetical protein